MRPDSDHFSFLNLLGYRPLARLRPRHAREIESSPWGIGCETLDRGYVDWKQVAPHLGELGVKRVRLQAGWARCEPRPGHYDWTWLDEVVDEALAVGVRPWLQLSYGNPAYAGGGGIGLAQGIPSTEEALAANVRWAGAIVSRYRGRVHAYEIWNEPDLHAAVTVEAFTAYHIRIAEAVRAADPSAKILGLALCYDTEFADDFLAALAAAGRRDLLDEITYHTYPHIPEWDIGLGDRIARLCARNGYAPMPIHQGETGAPSDKVQVGALNNLVWNERKQAAWNLRRCLAHHAVGRAVSLFQIADMYYNKTTGGLFEGCNPKGLLRVRPDLTVAYRKPAYFAAQHLFSVFDGAFPVQPLPAFPSRSPLPLRAHAWGRTGATRPELVAWWLADTPPECLAPAPTPVSLDAVALEDPVLVDFMSGMVFQAPEAFADRPAAWWANLPALDAPLAIAERAILPLREL